MKLKRIICLTLIFALSLSFTSFAALKEDDFTAAFNNQIFCAEANVKISYNVDKISETLKKAMYNDNSFVKDELVEYDIKFITDADLKHIMANIQFMLSSASSPEINKGPVEQYTEIDFSGGRPFYVNVVAEPDAEYAIYYNFADIPQFQPYVYSLQDAVLNGEYKNIFSVPEGAKKEIRNDKYIVKYSDKEVKKLLSSDDMFIKDAVILGATPSVSGFEDYIPYLTDIPLFGTNGMTVQTTLDKEKNLDKITVTLDINTNMYDVLYRLKDINPEISLTGLTKDNSAYKATLKAEIDLNNINKDFDIAIPDLNKTPVYNYSSELVQNYFLTTLEENKVNVYTYNTKVNFTDAEPVIENGRTLVPLRKFLNSLGVKDDDIIYEDGYITVNYKNEKTVKLNVFDTNASVTTGGATTPITLDVSAKMVNDRTLVPLRFLSETFDCEVVFQELDEQTSFINIVPNY